jgi:hypothetical protein
MKLDSTRQRQHLYSLEEASGELGGVSTWTLRKHAGQGTLKLTRVGRRVFLSADEVARIGREGLPSLTAVARREPGQAP